MVRLKSSTEQFPRSPQMLTPARVSCTPETFDSHSILVDCILLGTVTVDRKGRVISGKRNDERSEKNTYTGPNNSSRVKI